MSDPIFLRDVLFTLAYIALGAALALLLLLYRKLTQAKRSMVHRPSADLMELAILYQQMRATVDEQKVLARDLNSDVEKKVDLMRKVFRHTLAEQKILTKRQKELTDALQEVREVLAQVEAQIGLRAEAQVRHEAETPPAAAPEAPLNAVVAPEDSRENAADEPEEEWAGLDFVEADASKEPFAVPDIPPPEPRDPEGAREAFRALLNMEGKSPLESVRPVVAATGTNGRSRTDTLKRRVNEYHDAGMSVAQIAQELGIGKGEVRLMISLREKG